MPPPRHVILTLLAIAWQQIVFCKGFSVVPMTLMMKRRACRISPRSYHSFPSAVNNKNKISARGTAVKHMSAAATSSGSDKEDEYCELGDYCEVADELLLDADKLTLTQDLGKRTTEITHQNWKDSTGLQRRYKTTKPIILDNGDKIRKIAMDHWPIAICGSTSGSIYLLDLEKGQVLHSLPNVHDPIGDGTSKTNDNIVGVHKTTIDDIQKALKLKEGFFVGKGIVSAAIRGDVVATAGREGGACIWKIIDNKLVLQGQLGNLKDTIVTCLSFDDRQRLWTGSFDGNICVYNGDKLKSSSKNEEDDTNCYDFQPGIQTNLEAGPILDLSISDDFYCGACACADGSIQLVDIDRGDIITSFGAFRSGVIAKSVLLVRDQNGNGSIVCGGSNGALYRHELKLDQECTEFSAASPQMADATCQIDEYDPLKVLEEKVAKLKPAHHGPVVCLKSPFEGMFLSAAQDGTVKVWECTSFADDEEDDEAEEKGRYPSLEEPQDGRPRCRFILKGYTPYMSTIATDGFRLISDGNKNKVNMRDFTMQQDL